MHGSRSKIPSKNLVRQRSAEGFNSGVKGLSKAARACCFLLQSKLCTGFLLKESTPYSAFVAEQYFSQWTLVWKCIENVTLHHIVDDVCQVTKIRSVLVVHYHEMMFWKGKSEVHPRTGHEVPEGE
jgi:hypothetical protein